MENIKKIILDAYHFRYACKRFDKTRLISKEDFTVILEAGRLSPSSFGLEPWRFLVIQDPILRKKIKQVSSGAVNSLEGASHFLIILARKKIDLGYDSDYVIGMMKDVQKLPEETVTQKQKSFRKFQIEDFKLYESERALFDWACKQTYIPLANMMTAAALLGIDSCPVEGFNRADLERILQAENILDATYFGISVMAGFGYRAETAPPKTRQPLEQIVSYI